MNIRVDIGKNIRYFRKRANMTQEKLGFEAELGQKYISELESGKKMPTMRTLEKIAEALEITVPYLCAFGDGADVDDLTAYGDKYMMIIKEVAPEKRDAFTEAVAALARLTKNHIDNK